MLNRRRLTALALALVMVLSGSVTAWATETPNYYSDSRKCINADYDCAMGNGPVYSDQHPEVTDPEFLIKKYYCYPGEPDFQEVEPEYAAYTETGTKFPYTNHMDEALPLLQEFVRSFDWIHSDEKTRYEAVYKRIGRFYSGNYYDEVAGWQRCTEKFLVLRTKGGICEEFSREFAELCRIVGLECVTYLTSANHQNCLVKVDGQWFAVDPTNQTFQGHRAVDFDTEYNRFAREWDASEAGQRAARENEWARQAERGEITWTDYWRLMNPGRTDAEIEQGLGMTLAEYEALCKN